ncbi:MAG: DUF4080 domain-containing protein, partial [Thermodesulfobacteriota bacterium]
YDRSELPNNCTVIRGEVEGLAASFYEDLQQGSLAPEYDCATGQPFPSPYNDADLAGELQNRHIYYESTRGCPFNCSYCLSSVERGVTWKEIETVKQELALILKHRPKIIKFIDRTFNAKAERALEIWRFLVEQPGQTLFHFEMAPDLFTEEMFVFLADLPPGRFQFELGIQSTNPATLATVSRVMDLDKVNANMRRLAELDNIHLHADLILGLPEETEITFRKGVNDVFAMAPHYIQMGLLKVLPSTTISHTPGLVHCRQAPYQVISSAVMDQQTISQFYWLGECIEAFHNNRYFPSLFDYLRDQTEDICTFFEELLTICHEHNFFNLSTTQKFLTELLSKAVAERTDHQLCLDLIRYDWLRCDHRFLPESLSTDDLNTLRKSLSRSMDQNLSPLYDYRSRDEFFRKSIFARFSGQALKQLALADESKEGIVCFLPQKSAAIHSFKKTVLLP